MKKLEKGLELNLVIKENKLIKTTVQNMRIYLHFSQASVSDD